MQLPSFVGTSRPVTSRAQTSSWFRVVVATMIVAIMMSVPEVKAWVGTRSFGLMDPAYRSCSSRMRLRVLETPQSLNSTMSFDEPRIRSEDASATFAATNNQNDDNKNNRLESLEQFDHHQPAARAPRVDILLNRNAKGVNAEVIRVVEDVMEQYTNVRIHTTSTMEQAIAAAKDMTQDPPSLIIPLGGDGTLITLLQLLWDTGMDDPRGDNHGEVPLTTTNRRFPLIAYIAQGTGNALGSVVGSRPTFSGHRLERLRKGLLRRPSFLGGTSRKLSTLSETLHQLLRTAEQLHLGNMTLQNVDIVELPLIQVTTTSTTNDQPDHCQQHQENQRSELCFFSGVGFDSLMLQDYKDLQEWTGDEGQPLRRIFKDAFSSVFGYCVALVTRTLPGCITEQKHLISVKISTSDPKNTVWIDHRRGDVVRAVGDSRLLYQGEAGIVAVGSAPFYGGGLRLFPFARMTRDGMQLRVGRIHPLRGTINIPQIFQGSYRDLRDDSFGCIDFMGQHFQVDILSPSIGYPVQHSGDFVGTSKRIEYDMMGDRLDPIRFLTLLPPRVVVVDDNDHGPSRE